MILPSLNWFRSMDRYFLAMGQNVNDVFQTVKIKTFLQKGPSYPDLMGRGWNIKIQIIPVA